MLTEDEMAKGTKGIGSLLSAASVLEEQLLNTEWAFRPPMCDGVATGEVTFALPPSMLSALQRHDYPELGTGIFDISDYRGSPGGKVSGTGPNARAEIFRNFCVYRTSTEADWGL